MAQSEESISTIAEGRSDTGTRPPGTPAITSESRPSLDEFGAILGACLFGAFLNRPMR
jgi:hypothetical protein